MSRYPFLPFAVLLVAGITGCETTKLQRDMLEDSTWETSEGEEDWDAESERRSRKERKQDESWEKKNAPMEAVPTAEESKPESNLAEPYQRVTEGVIARTALLPVLDDGLGRFLQNVETQPAFHKGAFVGFRILSLFPGEPAFASLDLRPGDTVTRINGKPIERPEQAIAVWEDLRTASNLIINYRRDGEAHALRFAIVDEG
ncbi:MAG: hypothetical protein WBN10_08440 [Polyangiales bacterium]